MIHRIIVTQCPTDRGHWSASFADAIHEAYGGDWPTVAMHRLFEACSERGIVPETVMATTESKPGRPVFTVDGAEPDWRTSFAKHAGM